MIPKTAIDLLYEIITDARKELIEGDSKDGHWEHVRRAMFILDPTNVGTKEAFAILREAFPEPTPALEGQKAGRFDAETLRAANQELASWAMDRWNAEVKNRPIENVHRRTLDATWRQVYRYATGEEMPTEAAHPTPEPRKEPDRCPACGGQGYVKTAPGYDRETCTLCEGTGKDIDAYPAPTEPEDAQGEAAPLHDYLEAMRRYEMGMGEKPIIDRMELAMIAFNKLAAEREWSAARLAALQTAEQRVRELEGTLAGEWRKGYIAAKADAELALAASKDEARGLREALEEIRDREWIENTLDPQWPAERARLALDHKDKQEPPHA